MNQQVMLVQKRREPAFLPVRSHPDDAGLDIRSAVETVLLPRTLLRVATNLSIAVPYGMMGLICPRSGLSQNLIKPYTSPGVIDSGFRGELFVLMMNEGEDPFPIKVGDRICQLVLVPVCLAPAEFCDNLPDSQWRGEKGWGSTGA